MENKQGGLSQREREVIQMAASGLRDRDIAIRLGIEQTTLKSHWMKIRRKLSASRMEIVEGLLRIEREEQAEPQPNHVEAPPGHQNSLEKYEAIGRFVGVAIARSKNKAWNLEVVGEAFANVFGVRSNELLGKSPLELPGISEREHFETIVDQIKRRGRSADVFRILRADGTCEVVTLDLSVVASFHEPPTLRILALRDG